MKKQRLRAAMLSAAMMLCGVTANLPDGFPAAAEVRSGDMQTVRRTVPGQGYDLFYEYGCMGDTSAMQNTAETQKGINVKWEDAQAPMACAGVTAIERNRENPDEEPVDLRDAFKTLNFGGEYSFQYDAALSVHGWLAEPRAEFYVLDGYLGTPGELLTESNYRGTLTLGSGKVYKIYQTDAKGKTPYADYESYLQYWSVPADQHIYPGTEMTFSRQTPLEPHFYAWAMLGMEIGTCEQIDIRLCTAQDSPRKETGMFVCGGPTGLANPNLDFTLRNRENRTVDSMCRGDLTADGKITRADLNKLGLLLSNFFDRHMTAFQERAADMNGDKKFDAKDKTLLKRKLLEAQSAQTSYDKAPDILPGTNRRLIFNDEFNGDMLDTNKWSCDTGNWKYSADDTSYVTGWGNNEQQYYTADNVSVGGGILYISARQYPYTDPEQGSFEYTSGKLISAHKFSTTGGRIEVRARCDSGKSLWPAIWMLPERETYGGWAASGEIDIMEGWGSKPEKICGTIHFGDAWPNNQYLTADYQFPAGTSAADWHVYAVEWEKDCIKWYVDDQLYSTQKEWSSSGYAYPAPFDQDFYLILNLAVGGHFDGVDGIYADPATFADCEKNFQIDYVRVYEPAEPFEAQEPVPEPMELYTEGADAALKNGNRGADITIGSVGTLEYAVMGLFRGKNVAAGVPVTLKFTADSSAARDMIVTVEDSAYTRFFEKTCHLTPGLQEYTETFTVPESMAVDLKFQLGNIGDAADCGPHTVRLYDIVFE